MNMNTTETKKVESVEKCDGEVCSVPATTTDSKVVTTKSSTKTEDAPWGFKKDGTPKKRPGRRKKS